MSTDNTQSRKSALERFFSLKPTRIIVCSFLFVILVGTILLALPFASRDNQSVGLLDAFFTSTSAVCVTGLTVVNTAMHWSAFGKMVILVLIQVGGLGLMTIFTTVIIFTGRTITLRERLVIQQSFNQEDLTGMVRLARNVCIVTFLCEAIAALILGLWFIFMHQQPVFFGLWSGLFHAVSGFCNAGFDIIGNSMESFVTDPVVNWVIMLVIIFGGLGFTVWLDLIKTVKTVKSEGRLSFKTVFDRLSLHTKIVLELTLGLIVLGALLFFIIEYNNPNTIGQMNVFDKGMASTFQSVTTRTAGFNTINQANMEPASQFITIVLMFIGGSPGGTAGGVKTVTFSIILLAIISVIRGRNQIEVHNKHIASYILQKALAVVMMNLTLISVATVILSITEKAIPGFSFLDYLFEVASAVGTVGLTTGITPELSVIGKLIICVCMFFGRLGPITVAVALTIRQITGDNSIHYPEGRVLVG